MVLFVLLLAFNIVAIHAFVSSIYDYSILPDERIWRFILLMLAWEFVLLLSATLLFYRLLITHIRTREKNREFLEIVMLSFTHKLGNFLASQAVNLGILQEKYGDIAVNRLLSEHKLIKSDMEQLSRIIEGFKSGTLKEEEKVNLKLILDKALEQAEDYLRGKRLLIYITRRRCEIVGIPEELNIAFYLLVDNAVKYSRDTIHVRLSRMKNKILFSIRNDINTEKSKGTGMGLSIVEKLCSRYRIKFRTREGEGYFTATMAIDTGLISWIISSL